MLRPRGPGQPRAHPGRTEAIAFAGSERGGKNESLRSAKFPSMNQLLISLPVEQQLLELKPNGSKISGAKNGATRVPPIVEPLSDVGGREAAFIGAILGETEPEISEIRKGRSPPGRRLLTWNSVAARFEARCAYA